MVKHLPTVLETQVQSLGREDALEKEMATHSSTLAWKIPYTEDPGRPQFMGSQSQTQLSDFTFTFTGKTIALTTWTFVGKVMCLLFNMQSMFVIAFLPRSKCILISWLQSPSAVILQPKRIKSLTVYIVSTSICHQVMGLDAIILVF